MFLVCAGSQIVPGKEFLRGCPSPEPGETALTGREWTIAIHCKGELPSTAKFRREEITQDNLTEQGKLLWLLVSTDVTVHIMICIMFRIFLSKGCCCLG